MVHAARVSVGNRRSPPPDPNRAQRLRGARVALGLSQQRLASMICVATGTISAAERSGTLTPGLAEKLAGVLALDAAELLR